MEAHNLGVRLATHTLKGFLYSPLLFIYLELAEMSEFGQENSDYK